MPAPPKVAAPWNEVSVLVRKLPAHWIKKAVTGQPQLLALFADDPNLCSWLARPSESSVEDRWPQSRNDLLSVLLARLQDAWACFHECVAITSCLRRSSRLRQGEWTDILQEAFVEHSRIGELAKHSSAVAACLNTLAPPKFDDIVPPLTHGDLAELRRSIDKHRQRCARDKFRHFALGGWDGASEDSILEALIRKEDRQLSDAVFARALATLSSLDREILRLDIAGHTLAEIGEIVHRAESTVCARLTKMTIRLSSFVDRETGP